MQRLANTPDQLARLLRSRRHELGMTQRDLAERAGLYQKTVSALENDPESRSVATLYRLLRALGLELALAPKPESPSSDGQPW